MLKSYEATFENNQIHWLAEKPDRSSGRIIVTVLEEDVPPVKRRSFPTHLIGQVKILGDIVSPIVDEEDWECLK